MEVDGAREGERWRGKGVWNEEGREEFRKRIEHSNRTEESGGRMDKVGRNGEGSIKRNRKGERRRCKEEDKIMG